VICILVFGLALFFPIYAAHLQDDKCGLAFTRFMELRPVGGKRVGKDASANMTLEEAEDAAAREGLVLVPSRKNRTGYKGLKQFAGRYEAAAWEEGGTRTYIGSYASKHKAALEYARWIGPQNAKREAAAVEAQAASANMTLEEAEDAAAREGLVLVPSRTNPTGYKGVTEKDGRYKANRKEEGTMTFIGSYASKHKAALEYARWIGPQNAKREAAAVEAQAEDANMTLEEAEDAAAREGLVLVPSRKNRTGYKGLRQVAGRYEATGEEEGTTTFIGSYASKHKAALEYARWIGPQNAMTLEEAEAIAARDGLVLVPSNSKTGYKGVSLKEGRFKANCKEYYIGSYATPYEAALEYARHIGPQQAAAEKATAMARRPTLLETAAGSITGVLAIARKRKPKN